MSWRLRLARSEQTLGRLEEAAVAYRAVLAETPRDREIEDALIDIYSELSEAEPLCALLEERLETTPSGSEDAVALHLRLAEEIEYARRMLEVMGDQLASDGTVVIRHCASLQTVDIVGQTLGHLASIIRSSAPDRAVQRIGMAELKARLTRRSIL